MNTQKLFDLNKSYKALFVLALFILLFVASIFAAYQIQQNFGQINVTNEYFKNESGIVIRAKLFTPQNATKQNPAPGVLFIHGYQSTRETGDGLAIELARRGFVVLSIDVIGRGNSGNPGTDVNAKNFDKSFGGLAALKHLKNYSFVNKNSIALLGHSLGGEKSFNIAKQDPAVKATVIIGFAYPKEVTPQMPKNMLMIFGKYDEFRQRMTGTRHVETQWMKTKQAQNAFAINNPKGSQTYGNFEKGTARRVVFPSALHVEEPHEKNTISETLIWMKNALKPNAKYWIDSQDQIWHLKEFFTLIALITCFATIFPLALILLRLKFFKPVRAPQNKNCFSKKREYLIHSLTNGLLMWLYLPLILMMFAIHKYIIPIDGAFPMMVVNGTVWWFFWINIIGFFLFIRWYKKGFQKQQPAALFKMGISFSKKRFWLDYSIIAKTALLSVALFFFVYLLEYIMESIFIVDLRFIFSFANDLTPQRWLMFLLYLPFFLVGFLQFGFFLHIQLKIKPANHWLKTFLTQTITNIAAMIIPIILMLCVQYIPLFTTGAIPLTGPGSMFVLMMINLVHMIGMLAIIIPISTWLFQLTQRPYAGSILCAAIVCWMLTSSQVIAPIPI